MKKVLLNAFAITFMIFLILHSQNVRAATTYTEGNYTYQISTVDSVNYAYITKYSGVEVDLQIPSVLGGMAVCGLGTNVLYNNTTTQTVIIPSSVTSMATGVFNTAYALRSISLESNSATGFHSTDGVLFNGTTLIAYPAAKSGSQYTIPNGTNYVKSYSFYGCSNLTKVVVPETVNYVNQTAFSRGQVALDVVIKKSGITKSYIDGAFWEMPAGSRYLVKNQSLKDTLDSTMTDKTAYSGETRIADTAVFANASTSLTFTDGSTSKSLSVSSGNTYQLATLITQTPSDTTEVVTWTSSDPATATVSSNGTLSAVKGGTVTLTGTDESGHSINLVLDVLEAINSYSLEYSSLNTTVDAEDYVTGYILPETSYAYAKGITWVSSNSSIASVSSYNSSQGVIRGIYPGTATVTGTINDNGTPVQRSMTVSVFANINSCTFSSLTTQTYTGTALTPDVSVTYKGSNLTKNTDYTVSYSNNNEAGYGYVTITGTGYFTGSKTLSFEIISNASSNNTSSGTTGSSDTSNTSAGTGTAGGSNNAGTSGSSGDTSIGTGTETVVKTLSAADITRSYKKNNTFYISTQNAQGQLSFTSLTKSIATVSKSSGKVTIKGLGYVRIRISDTKTVIYCNVYIVPGTQKISGFSDRSKKSFTVRYRADSNASGYQTQIATDNNFTQNIKSYSQSGNGNNSKNLKSLQRKTNYYVRVRSYVKKGSAKYYGNWSSVKVCKTK